MNEPLVSSDSTLLDLLRMRDAMTVAELAEALFVTATAVRQRLTRVMAGGYVDRVAVNRGRGRPVHSYRLTSKGRKKAGTNFADLAIALWEEIRAIEDVEVQRGLISRLSQRLASLYAGEVSGETVEERMLEVKALFAERQLPMSVQCGASTVENSGEENGEAKDGEASVDFPVLSVWACPYPDLAEKDRAICSLERMVFSELLNTKVQLSQCRLDGDACCTFEASRN